MDIDERIEEDLQIKNDIQNFRRQEVYSSRKDAFQINDVQFFSRYRFDKESVRYIIDLLKNNLPKIKSGIATGKSSVSKIFADNGIPVIDADLIARQIVEPGKSAWRKIRDAFGDIVLNDDGEINRDVLGKMVFSDIQLRRKLNEITHPVIHRTIFFQICQHFMTGRSYIVLDLPLLFETGILLDFIYKIITVTCEEDIQIKRLMDRSLLNEDEAKLRIASQMPLDKKCEKSNFVIENSGEFSKTEKEVLDILTMLNASNHHWRIRSYFLIAVGSVLLLFFWLNRLFNFAPSLNWR